MATPVRSSRAGYAKNVRRKSADFRSGLSAENNEDNNEDNPYTNAITARLYKSDYPMIIIPEQLPDDHNTRDITPSSLYYYYYFMLTIPRKLYLMFCYTRAITRANSGRGYVIADGDLVLI